MRQVIRVLKTPVTLILLLVILGYGAVWGYQQVTRDIPRSETPCVMQDVGETLTPDKVTVRVLNAGSVSGLAKLTRLYLNHYEFRVIYLNNSDRRVANTVVVGHAVDDPEVKLVQQFFAGATTEGDGRADHSVDVIVSGKNTQVENPVVTFPVTGPVCLPAIGTSGTASPSVTPSGSASPTPTKK